MTRGGAGRNQGRKKGNNKEYTVRIPLEIAQYLRDISGKNSISQGIVLLYNQHKK